MFPAGTESAELPLDGWVPSGRGETTVGANLPCDPDAQLYRCLAIGTPRLPDRGWALLDDDIPLVFPAEDQPEPGGHVLHQLVRPEGRAVIRPSPAQSDRVLGRRAAGPEAIDATADAEIGSVQSRHRATSVRAPIGRSAPAMGLPRYRGPMASLRSAVPGLAVAAALTLASCSEANKAAPPSTTLEISGVHTWACVSALALTGLNRGSSVGDARQVLSRLGKSDTVDRATKDYFEALTKALEGLTDAQQIGDSFDAVTCGLV